MKLIKIILYGAENEIYLVSKNWNSFIDTFNCK